MKIPFPIFLSLVSLLSMAAPLAAQPDTSLPQLIFEAVHNEPIANCYLQVPEDSVLWPYTDLAPWWLKQDAHDNLVGQRGGDYHVFRISPEGKFRNDLLSPVTATKPFWRFFGVDTLDRFWSFHNMSQEKDDQKQMDGTRFILYNDTGGVLEEIHPKWFIIPNTGPDTYDVFLQKLETALSNIQPDDIPLENFYGTGDGRMYFNRTIGISGPFINFETYYYLLDLHGKLIRKTRENIFDVSGNEYNQQYWTYREDTLSTLQYPVRWSSEYNATNFPLEAMPEDTGKNTPPMTFAAVNSHGLIAFRIVRSNDRDDRWGTKRMEYLIIDAKSEHVLAHNIFHWNEDTTKTSDLDRVILSSRGELLFLANEYDPVTSWKKEAHLNPFSSYFEPKMDTVLVPQGGKTYFRIYKLPIAYKTSERTFPSKNGLRK